MQKVMSKIIPECNGDYSIFYNEDKPYGVGWKPFVGNATHNNSGFHWQYRKASELDGYPHYAKMQVYSGGGYVVQLRGRIATIQQTLTDLEKHDWIDKYTRAVYAEFTTYNAQVNLFTVSTLVAEFVPSGGVFTSYRFEPVSLMPYFTGAMMFQLACEILFLCFIIFYLVKEVRSLMREKCEYFKSFWNWVEVAVVTFSIAGLVIYFYRMLVTNTLTTFFKATHGNEYMKFQYVAGWNELLHYLVGFVVFLATIKFLKLLRFNKRIAMLSSTLRHGAKDFFMFSIVFFIMFFAYVQFFFLIYKNDMIDFSSFIIAAETCLQMMLGRFAFQDMQQANPTLGPVMFFFFVVSITMILINMFLSILNETFTEVQHDLEKQGNEFEMVDFMIKRLKMFTGIGKEPLPDTKALGAELNNKKDGRAAAGMSPAFQVSRISNIQHICL